MESKKKIWVLNLRTDVSAEGVLQVPEGKEKHCFWLFSNFEKAKESMQQLILAYANTPNSIFDGHGLCTDFKNYMMKARATHDEFTDPYEPEEPDEAYFAWVETHGGYCDLSANLSKAEILPEILKSYLNDMKNFSPETIPENTWTDHLIGCKSSPDLIFIEGVDDGPCNDINPYFLINTFRMNDPEKEYSFRIRNAFCNDWDSVWTSIYIDMMPSEIDEELCFPLE